MLGELPALIAAGYEQVPEEDLVRLKWWGLYHDKPKIGTFMLRIKLPAGRVTPEQLQAVGELSLRVREGLGRALDAADDSAPLPRARLAAGGVPPARRGRADDRRRLRRRRPERDRLPRRRARPRRALRRHARHRGGDEASSTATRTTRTCRASTRSRSPRARTAATRRRSTASRSSARSGTASPASPSSSAAASRRCPGSHATSGSSSASTRRYRCCARSSMPGRKTSATASRA